VAVKRVAGQAASAPVAQETMPSSTSAQKAGAKRTVLKKTTAKKTASSSSVAKFPRQSVERALRIPRVLYEQNAGKPATPLEAAKFAGLGSAAGPFAVELSSAKKYGFLSVEGQKLALTERARRAIAPQSEDDKINALREAILDAPELSEVYNFYRGENLPDETFFLNALKERFHVPPGKIPEFSTVFNDSVLAAGLLDETGDRPRLIDIGRDTSPRKGPKTGEAKTLAATGESCFVMQPFAAPLGGYYNSIFKPAIEQTGLHPVRADADIFGTGKIMDQVWRGIRAAKVLVAELTTRNPNVFYELGLAHALVKPVVLVSSNEDDVPFDLRHIRIILYDMSDPFWGQKLIDKVADNIRSAIDDPEDAIFRVSDE
jgi:hypothetical protein